MKVLVVGSGAREHALAWKLAQSPLVSALFAAPGNAGTSHLGTNWTDMAATAVPGLTARAAEAGIGLAIIGPEAALAAGLADSLRRAGIPTFGPGRAGARLESSKAFAKHFMERHGIPTAACKIAHDAKQATKYLTGWQGPVVVKADGLAAGKGVVVCASSEKARVLVNDWYARRAVPGGGNTIVLEEALSGRELSVMALTDGRAVVELPVACDYKRAADGDTGPNTGGMGAYSAAVPVIDEETKASVRRDILERAVAGLASEGIEFRGCLYAGLMIGKLGPMVLEFNVRFGDPETQAVLPRVNSDLCALLLAAARGDISAGPQIDLSRRACVAVVLVSDGYPVRSTPLAGLPQPDLQRPVADVATFWGTSAVAADKVDSVGGRVMTVSALGSTLAEARSKAYDGVAAYRRSLPPGTKLRCRSDIGTSASVDSPQPMG
ncbi:MAG: phosphoribosylamine--glycine ligase [Candidatus Eremiobacteraeota bacterium]|nr:phosphoribosylamine--glycine ligase [Candidatus Eremiobacteraeota bacterium]MBC5826631.1 phosphoribosylamine--glycine ligase [Candidatus Eremiobacteraeota bacterium]